MLIKTSNSAHIKPARVHEVGTLCSVTKHRRPCHTGRPVHAARPGSDVTDDAVLSDACSVTEYFEPGPRHQGRAARVLTLVMGRLGGEARTAAGDRCEGSQKGGRRGALLGSEVGEM